MTSQEPTTLDSLYQDIQRILLDWNNGKRPFSGEVRAIQSLIEHRENLARIDELENIWFSGNEADFKGIVTDITKGGQKLNERMWDLRSELTKKGNI
jgi:hypothetical protein